MDKLALYAVIGIILLLVGVVLSSIGNAYNNLGNNTANSCYYGTFSYNNATNSSGTCPLQMQNDSNNDFFYSSLVSTPSIILMALGVILFVPSIFLIIYGEYKAGLQKGRKKR